MTQIRFPESFPEPPVVATEAAGLSDAEIRFFHENGFLARQTITARQEVAVIRAILTELFDKEVGRREGALFDFAGPDHDRGGMRLPQLIDPRNFEPGLLKTTFFENSVAIARDLLGPEARFVADHALLKPARTGAETPWHQDDAFRPGSLDYNEVSIWMPLQAVDAVNGCMSFIPTSHRWDVLPHRLMSGDGRIHAVECHEGFDPARAVLCPIPAGGCTIHGNRTLHWAGPNNSDAPRLAYVLVFGTPAKAASLPRDHSWLADKNEPRLERRRRWMLRGGYFIHGWRRMIQIPQIGLRETTMRIRYKIGGGRRLPRRGSRRQP